VNLVIGLNGGSSHGQTPQQVLNGFVSTIVTNLTKGAHRTGHVFL
jgi:hypothetical protein